MRLKRITYKQNHNTFGGLIYPSDFYTGYPGTRNIAQRIVDDWIFDEQHRRSSILNIGENNKNYGK